MRKYPLTIALAICCLFIISGCKKDKEQANNSLKDITSFVFKMADNPGISANVNSSIKDDTIRVNLPQGTNLSQLVPTITFDGAAISPGNKTAQNFSTNIQYTVTARNGSSTTYTVVARLLSNAKEILSFAFRSADNSTLDADVNGIIGKDTILIYIDPSVDLTHLVPAITYKGNVLNPGSATVQNFSSPIRYTVTAKDGSSIAYTVIVSGNMTVYVGSTDNFLYALNAATGTLRWKSATNGPINSSPTLSGTTVYVGSDDYYLYAFDAATGNIRWKTKTGGPVEGNPTVAGSMVYVDHNSSSNNYASSALEAYDTATGIRQWYYLIQGPYQAQSPTVVNGIVYQTSPFSGPGLGAFDAATGVGLWENGSSNGFRWNPAVVDGTMYVGCVYYPLAAVDVQTNEVKWVYIDRDQYGAAVVVGGNGSPTVDGSSVFVPSYNYDMYAIDAAAGTLKWKFTQSNTIPANGWFSSAVVGNGLVFTGNSNGFIYALDETTGAVKWTYGTTNSSTGSAGNPTLANGFIYAGCSQGNFCALDARTGAVKWTFATGGSVYSGPCVTDAKGRLFHPGASGDHQ